MLPDIRTISDDVRLKLADIVRTEKSFKLPDLAFFNSAACDKHETVQVLCPQCGVNLRRHQRVGVAWLYLRKKALLADQVGTGKTLTAAGLIAMIKENGELENARVLIVMRPGALFQWKAELERVLPYTRVSVAVGTRPKRIETYLAPWDVMLIGSQMFQQDIEVVQHFDIRTLIVDDVDPLRHRDTRTAYCIKRLARDCDRVVIMTGTPLQKRLDELHSVLEPIGGRDTFGSVVAFTTRYLQENEVQLFNRSGHAVGVKKVVGYKHLDEFARLLRPFALRRTADDIDDVNLPAIIPNNIFLDLYPSQRAKYEELRQGVLEIVRSEGSRIKRVDALARFIYGAQICTGLVTIGEDDRAETSVKLDWVESKLIDGDLSDDKVVVFCQFKNSIRALQERLMRGGVGFETVWGEQSNSQARFRSQQRFWHDPDCKVLLGTVSIEQSLNLQVARHLINVDTILNPARMQQLSGRIRRDGSQFRTVYVHSLFTNNTQEANYLPLLESEQALSDYVWGEGNELFESLSPLQMMLLIGQAGAV